MRIDHSKLSEPLAHVLNAGATDAAGGQKATKPLVKGTDATNVDRLDQMLLKRLRAAQTSDAANSVVSFQDAQVRIKELQQAMARDLHAVRAAHGNMDSSRVRGLLSD
jgi:hypothetical protein